MKSELGGGPVGEDDLERRLESRFAAELDRAERDYPSLRVQREGGAGDRGRPRRAWPRLALAVVAVVALAAVGLVGMGLTYRSGSGPAAASAPGVVLRSDGIPSQIDGQRVYRVGEKTDWANLSGSFLLGGYVLQEVALCPSQAPLPSAEAALISWCGGLGLWPTGGTTGIFATSGGIIVANEGSSLLDGWVGGPAIVVRVHENDPEAAQCPTDTRAGCEAAVVVEAVVWPEVPAKVAGEHVYRAADQASFASLKGSFLLGGLFTKPSLMPPCPAQINETAAEQQLIPYCYILKIDGLAIAPLSNLDEPNNEIVVARVHVNDPLAAQCPADVRAQCEAGIVVESVVWKSSPYPEPSPTASSPGTTEGVNPASSAGTGPVASESVGPPPSIVPPATAGTIEPSSPVGVPAAVNGETVFGAGDLPTLGSFLFGGPLGRDTSCAVPTPANAAQPACGYWTVDGVKVGSTVALSGFKIGQLVVVRVTASKILVDCIEAPCPPAVFYLVTEIVWTGRSVSALPSSPALPTPPAPAAT